MNTDQIPTQGIETSSQYVQETFEMLFEGLKVGNDLPVKLEDLRNISTRISTQANFEEDSPEDNMYVSVRKACMSLIELLKLNNQLTGNDDLKMIFKDANVLDIGGGVSHKFPPIYGVMAKLLGAKQVTIVDVSNSDELKTDPDFGWTAKYVNFVQQNLLDITFNGDDLNAEPEMNIINSCSVTGPNEVAYKAVRSELYRRGKNSIVMEDVEESLREQAATLLANGGYYIATESTQRGNRNRYVKEDNKLKLIA